jgi:hypothetical protein
MIRLSLSSFQRNQAVPRNEARAGESLRDSICGEDDLFSRVSLPPTEH